MDMDMDMDGKFHIHGNPAWTPLGAQPPDPVVGWRSARSPCVSTPHLTWRRQVFGFQLSF